MDAATLRELLDYDQKTGAFTWRLRTGPNAPQGDRAGCVNGRGNVRIKIRGRFYLAHRLAWLHTHGEWPPHEIDHINGVRSDNRLVNLRLATRSQNQRNIALRRDNKSGVKGVTWHKEAHKWQAQIQVKGRNMYLGRFERLEDAADAYKRAAINLHGDFANLG